MLSEKITILIKILITLIIQFFYAVSGITHCRDNFLQLPMLINDTGLISLNHSRLGLYYKKDINEI